MNPISEQEAKRLLAGIVIPPRPAVVTTILQEKGRDMPDLGRISQLIAGDVALAATVLKTVNSPLYGLQRRVNTIDHAVGMLGMANIATLVTGAALRSSMPAQNLDRFWDSAARTAGVCSYLAKQLGCVAPGDAHLFGLFRDCGIPLMMQRFSDYKDTLRLANAEATRAFTDVEDARHGTNHAIVGYLLASNWNLDTPMREAIRLHHDLKVYETGSTPMTMNLVALGVLAGHIENQYSRLSSDQEWTKLGAATTAHLMLSEDGLEELVSDAIAVLDQSGL